MLLIEDPEISWSKIDHVRNKAQSVYHGRHSHIVEHLQRIFSKVPQVETTQPIAAWLKF